MSLYWYIFVGLIRQGVGHMAQLKLHTAENCYLCGIKRCIFLFAYMLYACWKSGPVKKKCYVLHNTNLGIDIGHISSKLQTLLYFYMEIAMS